MDKCNEILGAILRPRCIHSHSSVQDPQLLPPPPIATRTPPLLPSHTSFGEGLQRRRGLYARPYQAYQTHAVPAQTPLTYSHLSYSLCIPQTSNTTWSAVTSRNVRMTLQLWGVSVVGRRLSTGELGYRFVAWCGNKCGQDEEDGCGF